MQKFHHNAVSSDSPEHFQVKHSLIATEKLMISRKKQIQVRRFEDPPPRKLCSSLPPMNYDRKDQDLDSIRFSDREAVQQGLKNSVRYNSNFFKFFYGNQDKLFKKPGKEITFLQPIQKIVREEINPVKNLQVQKSIKKFMNSCQESPVRDVDPGNKLLKNYEQEEIDCKSPNSTGVKFWKRSLPNLERVSSKIKCIALAGDIEDFEKNIPKVEKNKGNLWYKNLKVVNRT
jgi:hypothetical protein